MRLFGRFFQDPWWTGPCMDRAIKGLQLGQMDRRVERSVFTTIPRLSRLLRSDRFLEINEQIIPAGGRLKSYGVAQSSLNGKHVLKSWQTIETRRLFVDFNPKFDEPWLFAPTRIPDGTTVRFTDECHSPLRYVWQQGRPVVKVGRDEQQLLKQVDREIRKYLEMERQNEKTRRK